MLKIKSLFYVNTFLWRYHKSYIMSNTHASLKQIWKIENICIILKTKLLFCK